MTAVVPAGGGPLVDWHALAPYLVLAATMTVVTLAFPRPTPASERWPRVPLAGTLAGTAAAIALFVSLLVGGDERRLFEGRFVVGPAAAAAGAALTGSAYALILVVLVWRRGKAEPAGVAFAVIAAALGLAGLAAARDVLVAVVALELAAVPLSFLLTGVAGSWSHRGRPQQGLTAGLVALSLEAYGVAMAVVVCGSTRFAPLGGALRGPHRFAAIVTVVVLALAAVARAASVSWCWWAPGRAPTDETGSHRSAASGLPPRNGVKVG